MAKETRRRTPYKNFRFRVIWDGREVAGISKVSALKRTTQVIRHRDGADPGTTHKAPGQTDYDEISLDRGVTWDLEFDAWARKVFDDRAANGKLISLGDFRKDIRLEVLDEAGRVAVAYTLYHCWVSEYTALPELDASANAVAIQSIKLQYEGFERDIIPQLEDLKLDPIKWPA